VAAWAGEVSGSVVDATGQVVQGVTVIVQSTAPSTATAPSEGRIAVTDANGSYKIAVDGGEYLICVDAWSAGLLNPCEWSTAAPVSIAAAQTVRDHRIVLARGVRIAVRVDDPQKLRPNRQEGNLNVYAIPGVFDDAGHFHAARWMDTDGKGHVFELLVPADEDLHLSVDSMNAVVADSAGKSVAKTSRVKIKPKRGDRLEFQFTMKAG
jgi:hypothetical protein